MDQHLAFIAWSSTLPHTPKSKSKKIPIPKPDANKQFIKKVIARYDHKPAERVNNPSVGLARLMQTDQAWAADIRRTRHIGDFRNWKNHDEYQKAFQRLLRDLKAESQQEHV
jgi:hypothetical protein